MAGREVLHAGVLKQHDANVHEDEGAEVPSCQSSEARQHAFHAGGLQHAMQPAALGSQRREAATGIGWRGFASLRCSYMVEVRTP